MPFERLIENPQDPREIVGMHMPHEGKHSARHRARGIAHHEIDRIRPPHLAIKEILGIRPFNPEIRRLPTADPRGPARPAWPDGPHVGCFAYSAVGPWRRPERPNELAWGDQAGCFLR